MKEILEKSFANVEDPRSSRNQRHSFITLISTTVVSSLAGIDSFTGIARFVRNNLKNLEKYFDFPSGAPSHDTYQRLWDAIDPGQFYKAFNFFVEEMVSLNEGIINIDGKTIRNGGHAKPLHIVSAWCESNQLVLGQERVDEKSNEITAIPKLLSILNLNNRIVTIDAMGAQRSICKQITEQGGDYVVGLKRNQRTLFEDIKSHFQENENLKNCAFFKESSEGHGRKEHRLAFATNDIDWLQEKHN